MYVITPEDKFLTRPVLRVCHNDSPDTFTKLMLQQCTSLFIIASNKCRRKQTYYSASAYFMLGALVPKSLSSLEKKI